MAWSQIIGAAFAMLFLWLVSALLLWASASFIAYEFLPLDRMITRVIIVATGACWLWAAIILYLEERG